MTPFKKRTCKLTKRLAEDMIIRNMAPATSRRQLNSVRPITWSVT
jgi:hypothetical protein